MMTPDGIGVLLRGRRERAGRTREEQADLLSAAQGGRWFDPENLKRWETEKRLPVSASHKVIAQAYGLSAEAVTAAVGASRRFRNMTQEEQEDEVNRRGFIGAVAAVGITASVPSIAQAREGIDHALGRAGTDGDLAYLEAAFERHRGGYNGRAPNRVLADMAADVGLLREVLARPHPAGDRADLARTAAGIAGLVAIIQHDRGDERDAYGWFTTAEKAARESGDTRMRAWVLARHAMVPLNYHAPAAAARIAATARRAAGLQPTAAGALAAAVSARALAALGDQRGAVRAIADARNLAERLERSVRAGPSGCLLGMTHEPGVDQGWPTPREQEQVGVRERPLPPRHPGRQRRLRAHCSGRFTRISVCCPLATSFRSPSPWTPCTSSWQTLRVRPGGREEVGLVLDGEDLGVLVEQRECRVAAGAVRDGAGGAGVNVAVLLGHLRTGREHDVHAARGRCGRGARRGGP